MGRPRMRNSTVIASLAFIGVTVALAQGWLVKLRDHIKAATQQGSPSSAASDSSAGGTAGQLLEGPAGWGKIILSGPGG